MKKNTRNVGSVVKVLKYFTFSDPELAQATPTGGNESVFFIIASLLFLWGAVIIADVIYTKYKAKRRERG